MMRTKLLVRLFLTAVLFFLAASAPAQRISQTFNNVSLAKALTTLNAQSDGNYHITFIYNQLERFRVTAVIRNKSVPDAVRLLAKSAPAKLRVTVKGRNIMVDLKQRKTDIRGSVCDYVTRLPVPQSKVALINKDGEVLQEAGVFGSSTMNGKTTMLSNFYFQNVTEGSYTIRVTREGYETMHVPFVLEKIHAREMWRSIPAIPIKRESVRMLDEVLVVSTKVKFYYRGDTLVYNADAFQTAEGSMLDAIISQLPGVELKSNGQIYVNGKFVNSLLLNGKDFFKGDNTIMLDNLPAYAVKEIKVYDRQTEPDWGGKKRKEDNLVMDVTLKKEYRIGWMGNAEAGTGTDRRWMARLFAMRFSDHSQITMFANVNNTNDTHKPGQNDDWRPETAPTGVSTTRKTGLSYDIDFRNGHYEMNGSATITHTDANDVTHVHTTNFLQSENTLAQTFNRQQSHTKSLSTNHQLVYKKNGFYDDFIMLSPSFNYHKYQHTGDVSQFSYSADSSLVNRYLRQRLGKGSEYHATISLFAAKKMKYNADQIVVNGFFTTTGRRHEDFRVQTTDYPDIHTTDFLNHYTLEKPDVSTDFKLDVQYRYRISEKLGLGLGAGYTYSYRHTRNLLFRLDELSDWRDAIGTLPSVETYYQTLNLANSFERVLHENTPAAKLMLTWDILDNDDCFATLSAEAPLSLHHERLNYTHSDADTLVHRNYFAADITKIDLYWSTQDCKRSMNLSYSMNTVAPSASYLVDYRHDSDPLNIHIGNPKLRNGLLHEWRLIYENDMGNDEQQRNLSATATLKVLRNTLAMNRLYDKQTGVTIWQPQNVSGNWNASISMDYNTTLGKRRLLTLSDHLTGSYNHNADLINSQQSIVRTARVDNETRLDWKIGEHTIGAKLKLGWLHGASAREGFETVNGFDYNCGVTALLRLPWKLQLATDMTLFARRGYEDNAMNSTEWVWNARLTRPALKGKMTLAVDAFDILNQLSNVSRTLNAQCLTETWHNAIRRYVMFHAIWHFQVMPKKRRGSTE